MHALIEAKLSPGSVATAQSITFSPIAKMGIVAALATIAWTPIIAAAYAFSL